ncbi:phospho-sugar mutase [Brevibacillus thermoruber]|uniref:Phosphoglucomutase n=1 Tax=Brevibacillus thermoruber TaxID=33942 RepID=A0A9X3Z3Q4_9BACL|nr:phospho-sugar mutase [Brevibacillus thermoruber]MDA5108934.1 phospho-sugar mutase [Brevibacillus thermoruber]
MTEHWQDHYQRWTTFAHLDPELRAQLDSLRDDPHTLEDCFARQIEFGTGGMRGELGPGINRINLYTVRKASAGLARYVIGHGQAAMDAGVAIAYDSRHKSRTFAVEAANVLGWHGIRVHVFDRLCPTPLLSFAVRHLGAFAGIVITASHNPPEYNGYKVYGADGGQITPATAEALLKHMEEAGDELRIATADEPSLRESGLLRPIGGELLQAYLERLKSCRIPPAVQPAAGDPVRIVFTPLHGTTYEAITKGLDAFDYRHVTVVREQADPDPSFSTVSSPNPEEHQAFHLAIQYARKTGADLILGTDPDGDRLGVAVKNHQGDYVVLTGNQTGALLLHYLLSQKRKNGALPANGVVLKTIVTSEMGRAIASDFGLVTVDTLTGFKYIGEKIGEFEKTGAYAFQFGYEESCGFLLADFVRDKDAVQAALFMADACAFHKSEGRSLYDALLQLFATYGYYMEDLHAMTCKGKDGMANMASILSHLRSRPLTEISGKKVTAVEDYLAGERRDVAAGTTALLTFPKTDTLKYVLDDESWFCVRPSGTEPKIKLYFGVKGASLEDAEKKLAALKQAVAHLLENR